jgi:hypothetical protein
MVAAKALDKVGDCKLLRDPLTATAAFASFLDNASNKAAAQKVATWVEDRLVALAEVHPNIAKQGTTSPSLQPLVA